MEKLTMDAREWAKEFNRVLCQLGEKELDEGFLTGWFANAIMRGYDEARKPVEPSRGEQ